MKISILNGQLITWIDLFSQWAEVYDVPDDSLYKLATGTHFFDVETKELVAYEIPLAYEMPEPTQEEIAEQEAIQKEQEKENALKEVEVLLLRKQALDLAGESTVDTVVKLAGKLDAVIDLRDISESEKDALKFEVNAKL